MLQTSPDLVPRRHAPARSAAFWAAPLKLRVALGGLWVAIGCANSAAQTTPAAGPAAAQPGAVTQNPGDRSVGSASEIVCDRLVDDFSGSRLGEFPEGWTARDEADREAVKSLGYYVVEEQAGKRVLHATYTDHTITIGRKLLNWDLEQYPILEWRWRVTQLPTDGDETVSARNDTAAAVYAIWEIGFPFYVRGIKYAWSATLSEGTRHSKRFGYDRLIVVESGTRLLGEWQTERVDVRQHYAELFDEENPEPPSGIAIMTDADSTASQAEAYFADFRLCRYATRPAER